MKNHIKLFTILLGVLLLFSCKDKTNYSKIKSTPKTALSNTHKVVINAIKDAENYTYLNVDESGKAYWMAISSTSALKVGDTCYYIGGLIMKNFKSKQLDKTFDEIVFAEGVSLSPVVKTKTATNPHANAEVASVDNVKIAKAKNGITIEELYKNQKDYAKKSIIVRGKVVKVNNAIMDRNWVHIVDGTKYEKKSSLTISTNELVKVGDTITFKGTVTLDKDFGKGYVYPLLVEDGKLIK